ncbi:MAG: hypothetical protein R3B95_16575 [Nitrospirales bacterium]|nr:hypothetical protein [Nitrospirales bacterium]
MSTQKTAILQMVEAARQKGRRVDEVLATLGIKRAITGGRRAWEGGLPRQEGIG